MGYNAVVRRREAQETDCRSRTLGFVGALDNRVDVVAIVLGILDQRYANFVLAVASALALAGAAILYRWLQRGDLDPKFNYLLALSTLLAFVVCIATNYYVFKVPPDPPVLPPVWKCQGLFNPTTNSCFTGDVAKCNLPDFCFVFNRGGCFNCSNVTKWLPTPTPAPTPP